MAIIDVYDALTNKRVYKPAITHKQALDTILSERGQHFDPNIVDAFIEIEKDILQIAARYAQNTKYNPSAVKYTIDCLNRQLAKWAM